MALFSESTDDAVYVVRSSTEELLGTFSPHKILLDEQPWPSVEHYYQAMKFEPGDYFNQILEAPEPAIAYKLGEARFKRHRKGWKVNRIMYMTRGVYAKSKAYPQVLECLLETGDKPIIERTLYDYYWGYGRDGRGANNYGKVLMRVRQRLLEEQNSAAP